MREKERRILKRRKVFEIAMRLSAAIFVAVLIVLLLQWHSNTMHLWICALIASGIIHLFTRFIHWLTYTSIEYCKAVTTSYEEMLSRSIESLAGARKKLDYNLTEQHGDEDLPLSHLTIKDQPEYQGLTLNRAEVLRRQSQIVKNLELEVEGLKERVARLRATLTELEKNEKTIE